MADLIDKGKNLAKFSWDLVSYIQTHKESIFASDDLYRERMMICKSCDKYKELENECKLCGCYVPMKAKIILDSCPINKWTPSNKEWNERFDDVIKEIGEKS